MKVRIKLTINNKYAVRNKLVHRMGNFFQLIPTDYVDPAKGQIISECLFDVFQFFKKPPKNLTNFCPSI